MRPYFFLLLLFFIVSCNISETPLPSDTGMDDDQQAHNERADLASAEHEILELMPVAASMSLEAMKQLGSSQASPTLDSVKSQSLTVLFLFFNPNHVDVSVEDFERHVAWFANTYPRPSELIAPMMASQNDGYASVIQPGSINALGCKIEGDHATGRAIFELTGIFEATVDYAAQRADDSWKITSFEIPRLQAKTVLQDDGSWKASGQGVAPVFSVQLPDLDLIGPRVESAGRLIISARRSFDGNHEVSIREEKSSLEDFSNLLVRTLTAIKEDQGISAAKTTAVIRADRRMDSGSLHVILSECSTAGIPVFRLQATKSQSESTLFKELGEIPFTLFAETGSVKDFPPLKLEISADDKGGLGDIRLNNKAIGTVEDLHRNLLEILPDQDVELSVVTDPTLQYGHLAAVLGACITNTTSAPLTIKLVLAAENPTP